MSTTTIGPFEAKNERGETWSQRLCREFKEAAEYVDNLKRERDQAQLQWLKLRNRLILIADCKDTGGDPCGMARRTVDECTSACLVPKTPGETA